MTKLGEGSEVVITTLGKVNEVIVIPGTVSSGGSGAPSGPAGGALSGTYPNPTLASTDLTAIANLSPTNDDVIQRKSGAWVNRTMAQLKTDLAIVVANISDFASSVASAISTERTAVATYTNKDLSSGTNTFPTFNQSTTGSAATLTTSRTIGTLTGDATSAGSAFNGSANNTNAITLATVNSNVGSFGSASQVSTLTVNSKGLVTAAGQTSIAIPSTAVTDFAEAVRDTIGAALVEGAGIDITVDDGGDTITIAATGGGSGDMLAATYDPTNVAADVFDVDNHVDGTTNHVFTAADDTKLAGIATGATANDTDANLKNRANHTGTQTLATISDVTASAAELNILDGVTATAAELNALDGITATVTELNYTDGVTSAIQTQIDAKAPTASPTFTGTVSGVTKAHVGLGNVDNTADTAKPVSTAQQTALDLKADLASPALTGNPTAPTQTAGNNSTRVATTAYADAAVAAHTGDTTDAHDASAISFDETVEGWTSATTVQAALDEAGTVAAAANSDLQNAMTKNGGGQETVAAASGTSGTVTLSCNAASVFTLTPTGNVTTLTISNVTSGVGCTISLIVSQGATPRTIATPTGGVFIGAASPTQVANKVCVFTYFTVDGGTTWICSAAVQV